MALYACDEDDYVFAAEADPFKEYHCLECFSPVKVRKGKERFPHFYHVRASPKCRLYSKSEDHLVAQIELQRHFPPGELQMERPFSKINRVADLCWEKEKIVFEIQCSKLHPLEAESRIRDYKTLEYEVVWLLDDRLYNRSVLRPSEEFLRSQTCYFFHLKERKYYDQLEILAGNKRLKKSIKFAIDLQKPRFFGAKQLPKDLLPKQILTRASHICKYFHGDTIHKALQAPRFPSVALVMENWRVLEVHMAKNPERPQSKWAFWIQKHIFWPYLVLLKRFSRHLD